MSQTALVRIGAETGQAMAAPGLSGDELRAGFEAFGDKFEEAEQLWMPDLSVSEPAVSGWNPFNLPIPLESAPANEHGPAENAGQTTTLARYAPQRLAPDLPAKRLRVDPRLAGFFLKAIDWVIVLGGAELAARWSASASLATLAFGDAASILICALSIKLGLWLTDSYRAKPSEHCPEHAAGGLALGALLGIAISAMIAPNARAAGALAAILPIAGVLLAAIHAAFALWIKAAHRKGAFSENVVLIGATDAAQRFLDRAIKTGDARVVAIFDDRLGRSPTELGQAPVCGGIEDLLDWPSLAQIDRIVIAIPSKAEERVRMLLKAMRGLPQRIDLVLDVRVESVRGPGYQHLAEAAIARLSGAVSPGGRALLKRTQDLVLASVFLVLFSPIMALTALGVKLTSKGPLIYKQPHYGFNNRVITIYKFRSKRHNANELLSQVCARDPRVTPFGRFLRRTSLDELPQLFNVLKGEMSLVGPRPHAVGMRAAERELNDIVAEYAHRHRVKPGLTGWAQVNGSRGPIETPKSLRERVRLDIEYVMRASLWFDLWILLRTIPALLSGGKSVQK
jgi:Undecaprenyl-phosphate glucose phosphotransferase